MHPLVTQLIEHSRQEALERIRTGRAFHAPRRAVMEAAKAAASRARTPAQAAMMRWLAGGTAALPPR